MYSRRLELFLSLAWLGPVKSYYEDRSLFDIPSCGSVAPNIPKSSSSRTSILGIPNRCQWSRRPSIFFLIFETISMHCRLLRALKEGMCISQIVWFSVFTLIGPCLQNHVADCGKLRQGPFEQKMFNAVLTETREEWKNWCKQLNQARWTVNEHQINQTRWTVNEIDYMVPVCCLNVLSLER